MTPTIQNPLRVGVRRFDDHDRDAAGTRGNASSVTVAMNGNEAVSVASVGLSTRFALEQIRPNPFDPLTTIRYALPRRSPVRLSVHNRSGERVRVLYRFEAGEYTESRKLVLLE